MGKNADEDRDNNEALFRNRKEPTLGDILQSATEKINAQSRERLSRGDQENLYSPPQKGEVGYNTTWLQDMAKCLLDARYEEMMLFSEGIGADPAKVHQWAKTYIGE